MIGQMVSHYHILEKLGEGGMGVVYRAEDTRLRRSVALKVLSSQFARDPERRERFRQEARAAAALTHPGIATVYELGEVGEELYIVFEFVRGESLRKVVNRTRINPQTLLDVATDIARALVAAHTHGVVHRDLKPENIIRTPEGHTKILDFGLARFTPAGLSPETVSTRLTDPGAIVGTISYMSPEQLEGREVDFRSDIFSFGILLYELATGTQPFEGASPASTMARIMAGEPVPLTQRNPVAPPELERIVRKCLRKRAEERYQSTADLMVDLENLHRDSTQVSRAAVPLVEEPEQVLPHHLITRMGQSPRLWWELNHLFMMAGAAIPAYIAWQVKEWVPGWGLSFFFAVLGFVAVLVTLRGYLLVTAAFNPRALSREVRRVEPFQWALDLLFMVALLVMAVTIATTHTLSAAILFFIAMGGIVVRTVVEPTIARAAFPQAFASTETTPGQAAPAVLAPRPGLRRAAWMGGAAALLGLALAFTVGGWREKLFGPAAPIPPLPATAGPINSLAVLPLENLSGDPEQEYFVEGMHEELIARLAKISALKVISRTSVMRYKQALKPVSEIGRELDVDAVIEGSVRRAGNQVRITVQLVEAATDKHLWAESYDRDLSDILALQSEVAQAIVSQVRAQLTPQEQARFAATARPVSPAAHEAYLRGRYYWNKKTEEGMKKSLEYFQQAIAIEPNYALAYAGVADAYNTMTTRAYLSPREGRAKGRAAARQALEIEETLGEAHAALAFASFYYDWEWAEAEREFQRALELNPSYAPAHHWYSHYLIAMQRNGESLAESQRAFELDPLDLSINVHLGWHYYAVRDYDRAVKEVGKVIAMEPFVLAHIQQGLNLEQLGRFEEAIAELQKAITLSKVSTEALAYLGHVYAIADRGAEARQVLRRLQELELSGQNYVSSFDVAIIHAGLGEKEQAFAWLEKAYAEHSSGFSGLIYLNMDPRLDPLRSEPRFQDLLRRMNFPSR